VRAETLFFDGREERGADFAAHSRSAARYAVLLAQALGIDQEHHLIDIERGALLHDVGKIAVPEHILRKTSPLTAFEREIVREHPVIGYRMIEEFDSLKGAAEIVLCHHERFDGLGYPLGLTGDAIPLGARIFALADTLDAMTADRAYRCGLPFEDALREIEMSGGYQFDPAIVDVFLSVPVGDWRLAGSETAGFVRLPSVH
jgi:putative nucleotidyltransferase with HDIG domain